jgi:hypothetical protein
MLRAEKWASTCRSRYSAGRHCEPLFRMRGLSASRRWSSGPVGGMRYWLGGGWWVVVVLVVVVVVLVPFHCMTAQYPLLSTLTTMTSMIVMMVMAVVMVVMGVMEMFIHSLAHSLLLHPHLPDHSLTHPPSPNYIPTQAPSPPFRSLALAVQHHVDSNTRGAQSHRRAVYPRRAGVKRWNARRV